MKKAAGWFFILIFSFLTANHLNRYPNRTIRFPIFRKLYVLIQGSLECATTITQHCFNVLSNSRLEAIQSISTSWIVAEMCRWNSCEKSVSWAVIFLCVWLAVLEEQQIDSSRGRGWHRGADIQPIRRQLDVVQHGAAEAHQRHERLEQSAPQRRPARVQRQQSVQHEARQSRRQQLEQQQRWHQQQLRQHGHHPSAGQTTQPHLRSVRPLTSPYTGPHPQELYADFPQHWVPLLEIQLGFRYQSFVARALTHWLYPFSFSACSCSSSCCRPCRPSSFVWPSDATRPFWK